VTNKVIGIGEKEKKGEKTIVLPTCIPTRSCNECSNLIRHRINVSYLRKSWLVLLSYAFWIVVAIEDNPVDRQEGLFSLSLQIRQRFSIGLRLGEKGGY